MQADLAEVSVDELLASAERGSHTALSRLRALYSQALQALPKEEWEKEPTSFDSAWDLAVDDPQHRADLRKVVLYALIHEMKKFHIRYLRLGAAPFLDEEIPDFWYDLTEEQRWDFLKEHRMVWFEGLPIKDFWGVIAAHTSNLEREFVPDVLPGIPDFRPTASLAYLQIPVPENFDDKEYAQKLRHVEEHLNRVCQGQTPDVILRQIDQFAGALSLRFGPDIGLKKELQNRMTGLLTRIHQKRIWLRDQRRPTFLRDDVFAMLDLFEKDLYGR